MLTPDHMAMHTHMQCTARTPHAPRSTCMHIVCVGGGALVGTVQVQSRLGHAPHPPPRVFHPHGGQSGGWPPTLSSHVVSVYAGFVTWGDMVWPWPALWRGWTVPTARGPHTLTTQQCGAWGVRLLMRYLVTHAHIPHTNTRTYMPLLTHGVGGYTSHTRGCVAPHLWKPVQQLPI